MTSAKASPYHGSIKSILSNIFKFKHIYFTSFEKQVLATYTYLSRFCFLGTTPVLVLNVQANENPKVETHSRDLNLGPYDCEADALPHDHGHHTTD